ncbi:hypothetical protein AVEN_50913-1 [Araneus ventricosus]|uniref:Mos1 transposase HTH domain-containing protein n=1 Tax=Araneus ventricosus TaxID=182803 RepID=A0A4Y2DZW8_ARAVE|nr:hypothetical protein AVEN_50913-1 [Araneus ventricosus]
MMDSSRSAQRAVIKFLRAEGEHASQIYRRMKEVYGGQCLARFTIFRWCQRYEAGHVNIKDSPRPGRDGNWIRQQPRSFYTEAIHSFPTLWDQCISVNSDCL